MSVTMDPTSTTPGSTTQTSSPSATQPDALANEQTFLKLLVAQLQNQDPLSPADPIQFVTQLTQYSQLEQLIGIRQNTANLPTDQSNSQTAATQTGS